jgi:uncharacterized protein
MPSPEFFTTFLRQTWWLTAEMAPYLLLGFTIAGLLRVFFNEDWVRKHLGQKGLRQILKAVVIGIPLPLCSCGVLPVAAGIRRQGGQRGAVAAFTAATPQTGVDSIAATVGMLGWLFATIRVGIAFANGIIAGLIVERWGDPPEKSPRAQPEPDSSCCGGSPKPAATTCCGEPAQPSSGCCHGEEHKAEETPTAFMPRLASGLRFGLVTLPRDLFGPLVVGLILAGMLSAFAPEDLFANLPGGQFGVYLAVTLIAMPLYVCSTGSIPMAFTFLGAGMSPGAVLIFLIAGPSSTVASATALWKLIGPRGTIGYILSIIATSWVCAIALDFSGLALLVTEAVHHHHEMGVNLFQQTAAGLLLAVLLFARLANRRAKAA